MEEDLFGQRHKARNCEESGRVSPITISIGNNYSINCSMAQAMSALGCFIQDLENEFAGTGMCHPQNHPITILGTDAIHDSDSLSSIDWLEPQFLTLSYEYDGYKVEYVFIVDMLVPSQWEGQLCRIRISSIQDNKDIFCINMKRGRLYVESFDVTVLKSEFIVFCAQRCCYYLDEILDIGQNVLEEIKNNSIDELITGYGDFTAKEVVEMIEQRDQLESFVSKPVRPTHKAMFSKCIFMTTCDTFKYERIKHQLQSNTLLYLPVFDILQGVPKDNTRKVLMGLLQENAHVSKKQELKQIIDALWIVLTDFELSDYSTLLDYYVAKENSSCFTSETESIYDPIENLFDVCKYFMRCKNCRHKTSFEESDSFEFLYSTLLSCCEITGNTPLFYCEQPAFRVFDVDPLCQLFENYVRSVLAHILLVDQIVNNP